ncbi:MAG TPA: diacylglycerol kinase family protein [Myxococcota bacterium]|jgi:YegS/Rv2252/BmrU family lipid kinase
MRAVLTRTLVIVNPFSRDGATGRRFSGVERRLREALGPLEVERTRAPRDAERLAREAVRAGVERLIVAGGDGTLSEVASGLLGAGLGAYARIGVLPFGTGGDFVKTLGIPRDLDRAIACIAEGKVRRIDASRVTLRGDDGRPRVYYGVNITSLGISALVVTLAERSPRFVGGSGAFLLGTVRAILRHRSYPVTLSVDGEVVHEGPLILATAGNGRWFGGGMLVCPQAWCDDGKLDVVVVAGLSRAQLLAKLYSIYRGTHLKDPAVQSFRGRVIEALGPAAVRLEIDGEPLGSLPARIEVLEGALSMLAPAP